MPLIHRIEDLQFICFAVVFGIMVLQAKGRQPAVLFVWCSYLLALVVAIVDFSVAQPLSLPANALILSILCTRYAVLAVGISAFVGAGKWFRRVCLAAVPVAFLMALAAKLGFQSRYSLPAYFVVAAIQLLCLSLLLLRSKERSTLVPRSLLAVLFLMSCAYRLNQMHFSLSQKTPHDIWLRDQGLFLNSTILGCLLPFAIVWMMNSRDHAFLLDQSLADPLTELLNRRGLSAAAQKEVARYNRQRMDFAVAVADLDHFKAINDAHGHVFGDHVLQVAARTLTAELRQTDVVARSGGEEFVMILPLTGTEEMAAVLERVRARVQQLELQTDDGERVLVRASIGMTNTRGRTNITWDELEKEADEALYRAKEMGRNQVVASAA